MPKWRGQCLACATSAPPSRSTIRRFDVETDRQKAGLVGVTANDAAQTTLDATLGNINKPSVWIDPDNGQSYYVVTYYDGKAVADTNALGQLPVRVSETGKAVPLGAYANIRRSLGPIAVERNQLQRAVHVLMQAEGRDIGTRCCRPRARPRRRPTDSAGSSSTSSVRFSSCASRSPDWDSRLDSR